MIGAGHIWDDYRPEDHLYARGRLHIRRQAAAIAAISGWLSACRKPYVAVSGGKDSVCVLDLVQQIAAQAGRQHVAVMWHDSGVEWPHTEEMIGRLIDLGLIAENKLIIASPRHDVLELKRLQSIGEMSAATKDRLALFDPVNQVVAAHGFDGAALGLRKEESRARLLNRCIRGLVYRKKDGLLNCNPIGDWTWRDVFAYTAARRLPLHPIYSAPLYNLEHRGRIRLSWWASTDHYRYGQIQWVRLAYPEIYQRLVQALPQVAQLT
ncbi:MAG: phosphoadenosine phosphosulfate reductase family protein [Desulfobulbales bacterium]|nr:phosphoadenosine phosphosulfate reductase family protein [Desulfobulbales bacterium]